MAFDYADLALTADELLREFGAPATLTRPADGTYNPATGTTSQPEPIVTSLIAVVFDYEQKFIDGTLIRAGDKNAFLPAIGVDLPLQGDVLNWQGTEYKVIACTPLAPAGVDLLYELQVRR